MIVTGFMGWVGCWCVFVCGEILGGGGRGMLS